MVSRFAIKWLFLVAIVGTIAAWYALASRADHNTAVSYEIRAAVPTEFLVTHIIQCRRWGGLETGPIYPRCGEERIFLNNNAPHTFRVKPSKDSVAKVMTEFLHPHYSAVNLRYDLAASYFPPRHHAGFEAFEPVSVDAIMAIQRYALSNNLELNRHFPRVDWGTQHLFQIASKYLPRAYIEQQSLPEVRDVVARVAQHNRWVFDHYRQNPGKQTESILRDIAQLETNNIAYEKLIYQILDVYDINGPRPDWSKARGPEHRFTNNEYERDRKALQGIFPHVPDWASTEELARIGRSEE